MHTKFNLLIWEGFLLFKMKLLTEINYLDQYATSFINVLVDYAPKLISAVLILFIGIWAIRFINNFARKIMLRRNVEPTLIEFLSDILFWGLRILLFIAVISKLGIESSSFVAILGAAGLAVGLSLQGSLSNFAGGMLIILFKPFKLGDTIEAQNVSGTVVDIQIFVTQLLTSNNQAIFIPNGILSNGVIINYSQQHNRRTDLLFSVSYDTDIKQAKDLIMNILDNDPKILKHPKPTVSIAELTDSSIKFAIRAWSATADFGDVSSGILENSKTAFDAAGISIQPFVKEFSKTQSK